MAGRPSQPLAARLMAKVEIGISPRGCWEWTGSLRGGYGQIRVRTAGGWTVAGAHRVSYELARGPIPPRLDLDHLCRNTICVNPDHLEPVTRKVNVLRGVGVAAVNARKQRCVAGHQFTAARYPDGRRRCLICDPVAVTGVTSCHHCAGEVVQLGRGRPRRFCSDECRIAFHNQLRWPRSA